MDEASRIRDWLLEIARLRSTDVVDVPGGIAVRHRDFPSAHDHNRLIITSAVTPDQVCAAAETELGGAGLGHRLIDFGNAELTRMVGPELVERGYSRSDVLIMTFPGPAPAPSAIEIVELAPDERAAVAATDWRAERPEWGPEVWAQLGDRIVTILPAADCSFLAVRSPDGAVIARADLYLRDGVAQIEEVMTVPSARNRGLASALVREGICRARLDDARLIFLIADADDWPADLYRRLGFEAVAEVASFTR